MGKYIDCTGERFGRWTVLEKDEKATKKYGRVYFKCRCNCGTERSVCARDLRNGKSLSCGCLQREATSKATREDLTNERHGRLVPYEIDEEKSKPGDIYWKCRCDCGNITSVSSRNLRSNSIRSCGCLRKEISSRPNRYELFGEYGKCYFNDSNEFFLFDTRDLDIVTSHTWRKSNGYVRSDEMRIDGNIHAIMFHRKVMSKYNNNIIDLDIDHKDHNPLNNRYDNLRLCTRSENQLNRNFKNISSTGERNIYLNRLNDKFRFESKFDGNTKYAYFNTLKEAKEFKNKYFMENPNEFRYNLFEDSRNKDSKIIIPFEIIDKDKFYKNKMT